MASQEKRVQSVVQKIIHGHAAPKAAKSTPRLVLAPFPARARKKVKVPEQQEVEPTGTPETGEREIHIHIHAQ